MPDDENGSRAKKFVVDGILPRNLVHLVAAPVGTGKTTLFMQQIDAMQTSKQFLTREAFNSRVVYITADRGRTETESTLARLGLPDVKLELVSLKDKRGSVPYLELLITDNCQKGDVVFVEPLNFFLRDGQNRTGDINNFGHVSNFLLKIGRLAEDLMITVEGSLHSSKAKQGAEYMVAREKVIGSVAWTAFTATTIVLEPTNPGVADDPGRTIHVLPRDMRAFSLDYVVEPERGLLIPAAATVVFKSHLDVKLGELDKDAMFTTGDLEKWGEEAGVSWATVKRWVAQKIKDGYVENTERGIYRKRQTV